MREGSARRSRATAVAAGAAVLVAVGGLSGAVAAGNGSTGGGASAQGGNPHYSGANWGIIDRNVIGAGDAFLRSGPSVANSEGVATPPMGMGSLGIRTASGDDQAAFGNQVDFVGDRLADVSTAKYSVFTTGENASASEGNLPNIKVEVDPGVSDSESNEINYSTLVFVPDSADPNTWTDIDASSAARWYLTGKAGAETGCTQASYCTLAEVKDRAPDATIYTVGIGKGRDHAFSGAVDALVWGDATYDFEPNGVVSK